MGLRLAFLFVLSALVAVTTASTAAAGPLRTAITDPTKFVGPGNGKAFDRTRATGASVVRLVLNWHDVAFHEPADPTNPADTSYFWSDFDDQVRKATARGLDPIASVQYAPPWVGQRWDPDPVALGEFAAAAAARYDGTFVPPGETEPLPRIRSWQVWNEPNRNAFLQPQWVGDALVSPARYRAMVNEVADAVHAVHEDNLVVAGGLAPLGRAGQGPAPIRFMRDLMAQPVKLDVWSHHPYTSGGPTHKAAGSGNVALGNLPTMRALLYDNVRAGRVLTSRSNVQFWVTEFSWDTKGPDPQAVPMKLHARWTSEALYRMWLRGINLVTWFRIQDDPLNVSHYQSGFFTVSGARKRSFQAFRFPFVAFRHPGRIAIWGRTPTSGPGKVAIQVKVGKRWRTLTTLRATQAGMFRKTIRTPYAKGLVRAKTPREASIPFSLTRPPDRWVNPFGCGGLYPC